MIKMSIPYPVGNIQVFDQHQEQEKMVFLHQDPLQQLCMKGLATGRRVKSSEMKSKKKSNPKRNTIKNLGNQIISFMCGERA